MRRVAHQFTLLFALLALATGLVAVPAAAAPARGLGPTSERAAEPCTRGNASREWREDLGDGSRGTDIYWMGVWNKPGHTCFWVTVSGRFGVRKAQVIQVLIDTDRHHDGAEFIAFSYSSRDEDNRTGSYLIVRSVADEWVYVDDCQVMSQYKIGKNYIGIGMDKMCLGNPAKISVKAQIFDITKYKPNNSWRGRGDQIPNTGLTPFV